MSRRLMVLIPAAALGFAAAAVAGGWVWARTALDQTWRAWLAEQRAAGYSFANAEPEIGGFPRRVTARFDSPAVRAPAGWAWKLPDAAARAPITAPLTVRLRAPGTHRITTIRGRRIPADTAMARGRLHLTTGGRLRRGRLRVTGLRLRNLPPGQLKAQRVTLTIRPARYRADRRLPMRLTARDIRLPGAMKTPLGRDVQNLDVKAVATGPLPAKLTPAALRTWRTRGGTVELPRLHLVWSKLTVRGDGHLTLDAELRPKGKLTLHVKGARRAIRHFNETGVIRPRIAGLARMAVAALDQVGKNGDTPGIRIPIRFHEGRVHLGPVALWRLSPVLGDRKPRPDAPR